MASILEPSSDFTKLPEIAGRGLYRAAAKTRPILVRTGSRPAQTEYDSDDDAIWNDLFARQMKVLPGRAVGAFMAGLEKLDLGRGGVPDFGKNVGGAERADRVERGACANADPPITCFSGTSPIAASPQATSSARARHSTIFRNPTCSTMCFGPRTDADRSDFRRLHAGIWQGRLETRCGTTG